MKEFEFTDSDGCKWRRVSKPIAKFAYNIGLQMVICSSKYIPIGDWAIDVVINSNERNQIDSFEYVCAIQPENTIHFYAKIN